MDNPNKKRLSDVAKQTTTDRASKLVSGFLPPAPVAKVATPEPELASVPEPAVESMTEAVTEPITEAKPVVQQQAASNPPKAKPEKAERPKRGAAPVGFIEMITQALPDGVKCDRPIMLAGDHHELLREFSFTQKKPMTEILYNLLEYATQAYQREQQKHA